MPKTKYIVRGDFVHTPGKITVDGVPIKRVEDFKYLGTSVGSVGRDIEERCKAASRAYGCLMPVWKAPLRVETKLRVFFTSDMPCAPPGGRRAQGSSYPPPGDGGSGEHELWYWRADSPVGKCSQLVVNRGSDISSE